MRPRDLLAFLHRAIEVALNRLHANVTAEDIKQAEDSYSEDLLLATAFEIGDTHYELRNLLYAFEHLDAAITVTHMKQILGARGPGR